MADEKTEIAPEAVRFYAMSQTSASGRWCPFARVTWAEVTPDGRHKTSGHPSFNRTHISFGDGQRHHGTCLGDACMAWRYADRALNSGYCGLAGTPAFLITECEAA